jgi:hypothetical protein
MQSARQAYSRQFLDRQGAGEAHPTIGRRRPTATNLAPEKSLVARPELTTEKVGNSIAVSIVRTIYADPLGPNHVVPFGDAFCSFHTEIHQLGNMHEAMRRGKEAKTSQKL